MLLAGGKTVPVSQLRPGDKVLATSVKTGKTQPETVTAVLVNHDRDLYDLTIRSGNKTAVVHTTSNYLFWDPYLHQWVPASKLAKDEHLKTANGAVAVVVVGAAPKQHDGWMWDPTVPGNNDHDFYVTAGTVAVLAHNIDRCGDAGDGQSSLTPADLSGSTLSNYNRFLKRIPSGAEEPTIIQLPNGSVQFDADVPARNIPGSYATYTKAVDPEGNTVTFYKTTRAPYGSVVHVKVKYL